MTKCILIFDDLQKCLELLNTCKEKKIFLLENLLIIPPDEKISQDHRDLLKENKTLLNTSSIEEMRILNPQLDRNLRQKSMRNWLMPFGFIAGLTFSNMTNLSTFAFLGLSKISNSILGGILGMGSGLLGSFVASASINLNRDKELRPIYNFHKGGNWIVFLENQIGYELPWIIIRESEPLDIIFLEN